MLARRVPCAQAEGLVHISPGQRPGFADSFVIAGQRPASQVLGQEEYRNLLKTYHVEFDERYVWD